jgi:hypothetical protein
MQRFRWLIIFWALFTFFAQPGTPACWLEKTACEAHPHPDGHPERPHSHQYLFDDTQSTSSTVPQRTIPAWQYLKMLRENSIARQLHQPAITLHGWEVSFEPPPPR